VKIALIRKSYTPFGGAERHVDRFLDALRGRGHEVHLFAARWNGEARSGLTVHRVPVVTAPRWAEAWSFAVRAPRMAAAGGFDLVHSFDRVHSCDVYRAGDGVHREWLQRRRAAQPAWRRAIPSFNPLHRVYLTLERGLFEGRCRVVIANSARGKAEILAHYRADPDRIRVVYNGVDLERFRPPNAQERDSARRAAGVAPTERLAILVGSGFERKGAATAVRAAAALAKGGANATRLAVIGRGRPEPYQRLAGALGVADRVSFVGPVTDVRPWYAAADALILPTLYDPFANVCLEALACGVPVVTSSANGAAEILDAGAGAVIEDASDAEAFARALDRLWTSGGDRAAACRRTAERFPEARQVADTLAVYDELRPR
jgi:UDP-glucose:(heptosyl)LPS alpha-1,3-glucosyltransferase